MLKHTICTEDLDSLHASLFLFRTGNPKKHFENGVDRTIYFSFGRESENPFIGGANDFVELNTTIVRWGLSVVELWGDPGESPLQVGEHELEGLGPLLLRVELGFDGVGTAAAARVLDLALLHIHPVE